MLAIKIQFLFDDAVGFSTYLAYNDFVQDIIMYLIN